MENTKSAFIAIVGKPNVGKSSILNRLLGRKVAIVSEKPQTTRNRIMGILTENNSQYVFIDTPGLHIPKTKLGEIMVKSVNEAVSDIDGALLVVEPSKDIRPAEEELIKKFKGRKIPVILVINKIDTVKEKENLLQTIALYSNAYDFKAVVPISAVTGENFDDLKKELEGFLADGPFFFAEDDFTDQPERLIVSEIIREQILKLLDKEIPHGTAVVIERMRERENSNILDIEATIYCEKQSHKGIIIGKGGSMLKKIGSKARYDLEDFFSCKVNLQCWVKVKEEWRQRAGSIHNLGLDI
jgi:GTP-binding protein Era